MHVQGLCSNYNTLLKSCLYCRLKELCQNLQCLLPSAHLTPHLKKKKQLWDGLRAVPNLY